MYCQPGQLCDQGLQIPLELVRGHPIGHAKARMLGCIRYDPVPATAGALSHHRCRTLQADAGAAASPGLGLPLFASPQIVATSASGPPSALLAMLQLIV